jgi:hypothetical protein
METLPDRDGNIGQTVTTFKYDGRGHVVKAPSRHRIGIDDEDDPWPGERIMIAHRKRMLLRVAALIAVVWLGDVWGSRLLLKPRIDNRSKIAVGMTRRQVESILEAPPGDYGSGIGFPSPMGLCAAGPGLTPPSDARVLSWSYGKGDRGGYIQVAFDGGCVVWTKSGGRAVLVRPSLTQRLFHWVGLPVPH